MKNGTKMNKKGNEFKARTMEQRRKGNELRKKV